MEQYPFERLSADSKRALVLAQQEAERDHRGYIGTEHILLGLMLLGSGSAQRALADFNVDTTSVRNTINGTLARARVSTQEPTMPAAHVKRAIEIAFARSRRTLIERALARAKLSPAKPVIPTSRVKRTVEIAFEQSRRMGAEQVHSGHLLIGLAIEGEGIAAIVMKDFGATKDRVVAAVERELGVPNSAASTGPARPRPAPTAGNPAEPPASITALRERLASARLLLDSAKAAQDHENTLMLAGEVNRLGEALDRAESDWLNSLDDRAE